jgi:hypothetical protein
MCCAAFFVLLLPLNGINRVPSTSHIQINLRPPFAYIRIPSSAFSFHTITIRYYCLGDHSLLHLCLSVCCFLRPHRLHHEHGTSKRRGSGTLTIVEDPARDRWAIRFFGECLTRLLTLYTITSNYFQEAVRGMPNPRLV